MGDILAEENYQIYDKDLAMVIFQKKNADRTYKTFI